MKRQKKRRNTHARFGNPYHIHVSDRSCGWDKSLRIRNHRRMLWRPGNQIVEGGKEGLFVSMPSRKTQDGYRDICFPVTAEFRNELHTAVLDAYHQALTMAQTAPAPQAQPEAPKAGQQMSGM